jgi:hypothetical protein
MPGDNLRKRTFARAVGAHDGVYFAGVYVERQPAKNFGATYGGFQVLDF